MKSHEIAKYAVPSLVRHLSDFAIPRNSDQILQNKDAVIDKVAQATNNHGVVATLNDALNRYPEKLKTILPALVMQYPNLFEPDVYGRVDNKILDPRLIQKAYQDVGNSGLSNTEKAILKDGLNRDGTLPADKFS